METGTSFDLNTEINGWRQRLSQSPAIDTDDLDELESHLRETVAALVQRGLDGEEAFVLAIRRLGPHELIQAEFAKVNPDGVWLHRVLWMLIGVQAWALISGVSRFVADAALFTSVSAVGPRFAPTSLNLSSTLLPGGLFLVVQILTIVSLIVFAVLVLRTKGHERMPTEKRAVHMPLLVLLVLGGALAIVGLFASNQVLPMVFVRQLGADQFGVLAYSKSLASMAMFLTQTVVMAGLTILLGARLCGSGKTVVVRSG